MKIALVHDYLVQYGGAERVLEAFTELYPYAPIYVLVYDKDAMHGVFSDKKIHTSFLQKIPFSKKRHRIFPQFMPTAIEQFDLSNYDVILSDSSSYAKGVITSPEVLHICYMHTPMRYAWDDCQKYTSDFYFPEIIKKIIPFIMNYIRIWDRVSADRPDLIIANSNFVARRIKKYYKRDSVVIHPPVNTEKFSFISKEHNLSQSSLDNSGNGYFLMVGRLLAYKRNDIAIKAFNEMGIRLKIVGRGPELKNLQEIAAKNVEFLGRVSDEDLAECYANCRAFIFPQEEDFGIVAIEAMAAGKPIIAYRGGDIPEHVEEGVSGVFFDRQEPGDIIEAVKRFEHCNFDPKIIREKVLKFDKENFKAQIKHYIEEEFTKHKELKRHEDGTPSISGNI